MKLENKVEKDAYRTYTADTHSQQCDENTIPLLNVLPLGIKQLNCIFWSNLRFPIDEDCLLLVGITQACWPLVVVSHNTYPARSLVEIAVLVGTRLAPTRY
jgi:hypothetical protein